jgi:hypothetical protein
MAKPEKFSHKPYLNDIIRRLQEKKYFQVVMVAYNVNEKGSDEWMVGRDLDTTENVTFTADEWEIVGMKPVAVLGLLTSEQLANMVPPNFKGKLTGRLERRPDPEKILPKPGRN